MVASLAARRNRDDAVDTRITSIEPFERPWLEGLGVEVLRRKAEEVGPAPFQAHKAVCPHLAPASEPGSFWIRRREPRASG